MAENNKYIIPPKGKYEYRKFNLEKRKWSMKCGWCETKLTSHVDEGYYVVYDNQLHIGPERACSEDCSKLIWKDSVRNWFNSYGCKNHLNM